MAEAVRNRAATLIHDVQSSAQAAQDDGDKSIGSRTSSTAVVGAAHVDGSPTASSRGNVTSGDNHAAAAAKGKKGSSAGVKKEEGDSGAGNESGGGAAVSRCLVYCRLRPTNTIDFVDGGYQLVSFEKKRVVVKDERHYDFDGTFGANSTQEEVFEAVAVPCINHAFNGFCSALMCYGQTGTGKSFTMCNTKPGLEGIIPRSARLIFEKVAADSSRKHTVIGQFIQIYRDHLGDLMVGDGKEKVDIRCDNVEGVSFPGCSSHELTNAQEFMDFYNEGNERRVVTATAMNPESSRGHTAMVIWIHSENTDNPLAGKIKGKITFIDLAGYERFSKTGISNANPIMKDEAKTINASLLSLGHVVSSLSSGERHIPWRNSKLTRLLQDSIGGRSRTSIILTIGPSSDHLHETTNSLQFGLRAMAVKVEAKVSITVDYEKLAQKLQSMLDERDERINLLEVQIASRDAERQELLERYQRDREVLKEQFEKDMQHLSITGGSEEQIGKLKEIYKVEVENLNEQQKEEIEYQDEAHSKEITNLIKEQEHQEAMRRAEMKLAQERIIEDFQSKLSSAREGTNEDLVKAIRELAEKDALIASRANDTARLHEHIEVLTEQVKSLGGAPVREATFPETFLDVGQVEELQRRFEGEVERLHTKVVELRTQLDRMSLICNERMGDISDLQDANEQLRKNLADAGITTQETQEELRQLQLHRKELIDPLELETLRVSMQADIDELKAHNESLEREVEKLKEDAPLHSSLALLSRIRGAHVGSVAGETQFGESFTGSADLTCSASAQRRSGAPALDTASTGTGVAALEKRKEDMQHLTEQLLRGSKERSLLRHRVEELEKLLSQQGVNVAEALPPMESAGSPSVMIDAQNVSYEAAEAGSGEHATSDESTVGGASPALRTTQPSSLTAPAAAAAAADAEAMYPDAPSRDIAILLRVKDNENTALIELVSKQEHQLTTTRTSLEHYEKLTERLRQQIRNMGEAPEEVNNITQPVESVALDAYMDLVRTIRRNSTEVASRLIVRPEDAVPEDFALLLQEKDRELQLKDEMLLEKVALANYMAKLVSRLSGQMETLGLTPCCTLPESYRELGELDTEELNALRERQEALEKELEREENEKRKMKSLLQALSEERSHQASVFESYKSRVEEDLNVARAKNYELEQKENDVAEAMTRIAQEKSQKERVLEEAARRATREMMAMQARLARTKDSEEHVGLFGRLKKKFSL